MYKSCEFVCIQFLREYNSLDIQTTYTKAGCYLTDEY